MEHRPPEWDDRVRETALVALEAAVLTRRIFLPDRGTDHTPERWQILLALGLGDPGLTERPAGSAESVAVQLSLGRELVHDLLYGLLRDGLVDGVEEEPGEPPGFRLSPAGWKAVRTYVQRARRFLPGWPPPPPGSTRANSRSRA